MAALRYEISLRVLKNISRGGTITDYNFLRPLNTTRLLFVVGLQ